LIQKKIEFSDLSSDTPYLKALALNNDVSLASHRVVKRADFYTNNHDSDACESDLSSPFLAQENKRDGFQNVTKKHTIIH